MQSRAAAVAVMAMAVIAVLAFISMYSRNGGLVASRREPERAQAVAPPTLGPQLSATKDVSQLTAQPLVRDWAVAKSIALDKALARRATNVVSRLVQYDTYRQWSSRQGGGQFYDPIPYGPVWIVAFEAPGLTLEAFNETIDSQLGHDAGTALWPGTPSAADRPVPVEGAYYVWDASSGEGLGTGALLANTGPTFASIQALSDIVVTIVPASAVPPYPTYDATALPWPAGLP